LKPGEIGNVGCVKNCKVGGFVLIYRGLFEFIDPYQAISRSNKGCGAGLSFRLYVL
jgi:hypothetical protein